MVDSNKNLKLWNTFAEKENLSELQLQQFQKYAELLLDHNTRYNLTAIETIDQVIKYHFRDSMILKSACDLSQISSIADVGSGAGFPAIPLKILFPDIPMLLIEVTQKRQRFLKTVADELGLKDMQVYPNDWRTFLRTTEGEIPLFIARASLSVEELARMFKPASSYSNATLCYWASWGYEIPDGPKVKNCSFETFPYKIAYKKRKLVFVKSSIV